MTRFGLAPHIRCFPEFEVHQECPLGSVTLQCYQIWDLRLQKLDMGLHKWDMGLQTGSGAWGYRSGILEMGKLPRALTNICQCKRIQKLPWF